MDHLLNILRDALVHIQGYKVPMTQDQGSQCQMCISIADGAFYSVQGQVEAQKKVLEVLFAIGKLGDNQLHETYSKIDCLFAHKVGCEFTRAYCREKFHELLVPWDRLSANNKKSIVNLFLRMKYYGEEPAETNDILPVEFVYRAEFIKIAKAIVADYPTDEEKMRQFEFAPPYIYERAIPAAKILLEANESDIDHVNVLMIGDNGIGKSCLGNSFCRPPKNLELTEGNCTGVAMTTNIERVQYTLNGRSVCFIDTPGFYNTAKADKEKNLQFRDLPSYVNFILNQVASNAPHIPGEKIHIVLFCLQKPRIEDWQLSVINAIAEFAQVMVVQLQCSSEENLKFLEVMKTEIKSDNISSFHAVLAKDKTIKERTIPAHGMHDLARAMARELLNWKKKNDELSELFYANQDEYYGVLKKKAFAIIAGFSTACAAAGLSPIPFTDLAMIIPLHIGMFGAIMRLYGMKSPASTLRTIAHGLWTGAATNIPVTAARVALFGLEALKFVPLVNVFAMLGAAAFHGAATSISGVSFLRIIHKKALQGDFSEITEHNQHLILEEMKAEKVKLNAKQN